MNERLEKIIALFNKGATLQAIGDAVGVTKERARQLLAEEGIVATTRIRSTQDARRERVVAIARANPTLSTYKIAKQVGCGAHTVTADLKACGIKRDLFAIYSASAVQSKLRGRVELTRELLEREYITNNLSTTDIAKKYGYRQGGVMRRLTLYNIHKDKSLVYAQISKKRSGQKLVDGRYI
jgi:hypothetical protein